MRGWDVPPPLISRQYKYSLVSNKIIHRLPNSFIVTVTAYKYKNHTRNQVQRGRIISHGLSRRAMSLYLLHAWQRDQPNNGRFAVARPPVITVAAVVSHLCTFAGNTGFSSVCKAQLHASTQQSTSVALLRDVPEAAVNRTRSVLCHRLESPRSLGVVLHVDIVRTRLALLELEVQEDEIHGDSNCRKEGKRMLNA